MFCVSVCVFFHTALHAASLSGHVSTVKLLLERGAMVDSLDVMKHAPLFRACEMGHRDVILTLIKGWCNWYILYVQASKLSHFLFHCVLSIHLYLTILESWQY